MTNRKNPSHSIIILLFLAVSIALPAEQTRSFLFKPAGSNFTIYNRRGSNFFIHDSRLTRWKLARSIRRLASAKRITHAADDPSGLAVAEKMKGLITQLQRQSMNLQDYRNYLRYHDQVIARDMAALKRIRLLILRSSGSFLTANDRAINQSEINQMLREIDSNARFSTFNGKQVIPGLTTTGLGLENVNVVTNLYKSMGPVDAAIKKLLTMRGRAGARANIYAMRIKGKASYMINIQQAESRIRDLDMASEIRRLVKNNVLYRSNMGLIIKGTGR